LINYFDYPDQSTDITSKYILVKTKHGKPEAILSLETRIIIIIIYVMCTIYMFRVKFFSEKTFWNQNDRATFLVLQDCVEASTCMS